MSLGKRKVGGGGGRGARFSGPPAPKVTGVSDRTKMTVQDVMRKRVKALARQRELQAQADARKAQNRVDRVNQSLAMSGAKPWAKNVGPKGKNR